MTVEAIWFRGDLRRQDNPAVAKAVKAQMTNTERSVPAISVPAIFFATPETWQAHAWAPLKIDLLWRHLADFQADCAEHGIALSVVVVDSYADIPAALADWCAAQQVSTLHFNYEYPLDEAKRDKACLAALEQAQVATKAYHGLLLAPPQRIQTQQGGYYKMFTPFNRAWRQYLQQNYRWQPHQLTWPPACESPALPDCPLPRRDSSEWPVGEAAVLQRLRDYIDSNVAHYADERDLPALDSTSRLSPYWELGVLSPYTAARLLSEQSPDFPHGLNKGADIWLTELAWREFYQHLMFHEPRLCTGQAFQRYTDKFPWRDSEADFKRWCEGQTGYPIVDAGMRQLKAEGFMHNRLRMIVANFLVKDLRIDWRKGETFFMQNLIDGSFPANNGGWQWSASTGTDAVPYFRVFNPTRQSEKVDPEGEYIRTWVNELKGVPTKHIHAPHKWLAEHDSASQYPAPIVDHGEARQDFLDTFKGLTQ